MDVPRDGTRVLIQYYNKYYNGREYKRYKEPKWEECWWKDSELYGSKPHWEPWAGSYNTTSTHHIMDEDVVNWMILSENQY